MCVCVVCVCVCVCSYIVCVYDEYKNEWLSSSRRASVARVSSE